MTMVATTQLTRGQQLARLRAVQLLRFDYDNPVFIHEDEVSLRNSDKLVEQVANDYVEEISQLMTEILQGMRVWTFQVGEDIDSLLELVDE